MGGALGALAQAVSKGSSPSIEVTDLTVFVLSEYVSTGLQCLFFLPGEALVLGILGLQSGVLLVPLLLHLCWSWH